MAAPADERERELLKPFAAHIPPDILDGSYRLPVTDGSGRDRTTLRSALKLLSEAGYDLDGTVLRQRATKAPLTFEILVTTRDQERIALAYQPRPQARRHRGHACARSIPCSSTSAGSATSST